MEDVEDFDGYIHGVIVACLGKMKSHCISLFLYRMLKKWELNLCAMEFLVCPTYFRQVFSGNAVNQI